MERYKRMTLWMSDGGREESLSDSANWTSETASMVRDWSIQDNRRHNGRNLPVYVIFRHH
ncbi:MAG: hypothetical protein HN872_11930 [Gammaproteobacteria bacterium]|nr:hypothetical protein [Gammaproteobacteria bacterium]